MGTHPIFESDFDCLTDVMILLLAFLSPLLAQDLKLSGWLSCADWACSVPVQEGIARLNFIGVKTSEDIDWLTVRSGETLVVTGKDAGTFKGQQLLAGYIKGKEEEKGLVFSLTRLLGF